MRSTKSPSWIERLLGTAPVPPPPDVFVLGGHSLTFARCQLSGDTVELSSYRTVTLEEPLVTLGLLGGPLRQPEQLAEALASLLASLETKVTEATLVLPDEWFRVVFAGLDHLPEGRADRHQVLQWKLKRLVPFRVEDLRHGGVGVTPLPGQEEPERVLISFALEELLKSLEDTFQEAGVHLGLITGASLLSLDALRPAPDDSITALALVRENSYTLLFARGDEPILHRFKAADSPLPADARQRLVERDLKLSRNFLEEHYPGATFDRVLLAASQGFEGSWVQWLGSTLEAPVDLLAEDHIIAMTTDFQRGVPNAPSSWLDVLPILGVSRQEVA